jgi:hypothetical protein
MTDQFKIYGTGVEGEGVCHQLLVVLMVQI